MFASGSQQEETVLEAGDAASSTARLKARYRHYSIGIIKFMGGQFVGLAIFIALYMRLVTEPQPGSQCLCEFEASNHSPALSAVQGTEHRQRFDGSLISTNRYKGPPSPEIDAAWDELIIGGGLHAGAISIAKDTLNDINASVEFSVQLPPESGGGYLGSVEALHQLHCVNMLRQMSYQDYYRDKATSWKDRPDMLRHHLDHCIDNLRQKIMCDADATLFSYIWVKNRSTPVPDFNVQHICRNFEALQGWVKDHQAYVRKGVGLTRMPGSRDRPDIP